MVNIVEKIIDTYHIRKLIFNVLCLEVRTKPKPSLQDCWVPAQALVQKYPFLADASDGKQSHVNNYMQ